METLRSAIERLYEVFSRYPTPAKLGRCKHGQPSDEKAFLATPLRQFAAGDVALAHFSWEVLTTWGTVDDFKHFVPRLFEIAAFEKYRYDPEVLFGKLKKANCRSWPKPEHDAVGAYCRALWEHALAAYPISSALPSFAEIDDCLCSIAKAIDEIQPFLKRWEQPGSTAAIHHLADFVLANAQPLLAETKLVNAFWQDTPELEREVVKWLAKRTTAALLESDGKAHTEARRVLLRLQNSLVGG